MEEKKLVERPVMNEEEFKNYIQADKDVRTKVDEDFKNGIIHLHFYDGVSRFKSIRRAIKRGHVSPYGEVFPKRPFKNIKTYKSSITYLKKEAYAELHHKNRIQ